MNFLDAAYKVLSQANQPLHYTEITLRALKAGILDTKGQTPDASMGSRLYVDTKRPNSRFRRVSRGVFTLTEAASSDISQRIATINRQTRATLRKRLMEMPPERFEGLIAELLLALGFEEDTIEITPFGNDGGVDVRGVLNAASITEINAAVQAKRWKHNVQAPVVQALRGSLVVHEQGIIITTSEFSKGAETEAQAPGKVRISLIDGEKLLDLLIEHKIGVTAEQHTVYSLDEEWWGDVDEETDALVITAKQIPRPKVNYPVLITATAHGQTFEAELLDERGQVKFNGTLFRSPSGACQEASRWKSCNGWTFWKYFNGESGAWRPIEEIRSPKSAG
jgi:restriction system protein